MLVIWIENELNKDRLKQRMINCLADAHVKRGSFLFYDPISTADVPVLTGDESLLEYIESNRKHVNIEKLVR